jgi:hypothetical protein
MGGLFDRLPVASERPDFDLFWAAYPRRDAKIAARKAWDKACKKLPPETILAALKLFPFAPNREHQPLPASWLNGERFNDEACKPALQPHISVEPQKFDPSLQPYLAALKLPPAAALSWFAKAKVENGYLIAHSTFAANWIRGNFSQNLGWAGLKGVR